MVCDLRGCGGGLNGLRMGRTELMLELKRSVLWKYLEGVGM